MNPILFQDDVEKNLHEEAIKRLCDQYPGQQALIRKHYLENLEPQIANATIRTYLPIFISRKVEQSLKKTH